MPYRKPPPDAERCVKNVYRQGAWSPARCERRGVVERDDKLYCRQHDPVAVNEKREAQFVKWKVKQSAESDAERIREHKLATWDALLYACKSAAIALTPFYDLAEFRDILPTLTAAIKIAEKEPTS